MCEDCYEDYGRPVPDDAARAVAPLIAAVYAEHGCGGQLHIVLDDWAIDDGSLAFCLGLCDLTPAERACGEALAAMPEPQRVAALAIHERLA